MVKLEKNLLTNTLTIIGSWFGYAPSRFSSATSFHHVISKRKHLGAVTWQKMFLRVIIKE